MIKRKNAKGFTVVEILLVLIFVALVVLTGLYVMHNHKTSNSSKINNKVTANTTKLNSPSKTMDPYTGWKTYTSATEHANFKYPSTWTKTDTSGRYGDPSTDAVDLKSPSGAITISWASVVSGVGGACDDQVALNSNDPNTAVPCPQFTVFSKTAITGASGLYVITASVTDEGTTYRPWMAVQDSSGILTSKRTMDYSLYQTKNAGKDYLVLFSINGTNGTYTGASYSNPLQTAAFFGGAEAQQAKLILLSLTY
jgi:hypothetical protein